jgi:hypothetical protein
MKILPSFARTLQEKPPEFHEHVQSLTVGFTDEQLTARLKITFICELINLRMMKSGAESDFRAFSSAFPLLHVEPITLITGGGSIHRYIRGCAGYVIAKVRGCMKISERNAKPYPPGSAGFQDPFY